ncbi:DUF2586 domain-containing protein [Tenacibaculum ovolyticum]|uniref:DUF2586 domain-containing protein n=1 Tax=Tenacibaculum ovolyticum TaxID=104270 RepID=UPI0003FD03C4|nr:DUF2586 domain-containing protein [Tenacibaculum ovolyticum]
MGVLFNDVVINKLSGGLGRRTPSKDMVSGLLFNNLFAPAGNRKQKNVKQSQVLEKDKVYRLASLKDAKALGIDESYDVHGVSAFYQISQFFRMNPSGDLFIMASEEPNYGDLVKNKVEEMLLKTNGDIRQLAVIFNGNTEFSVTEIAIANAKTVTEKAFKDFRPLEIILEGKGFDPKTVTNLSEAGAENVSVVIAMDKEVIATNTNYGNTAAVGVLLGAISKAKVSENIAWVEKFNLTGEGFRSVGFIGGKELLSEGQMKTLDEARYIFTRKHTGVPGVYFNDSHTCTQRTSDFAFIEANRTINKAARIARTALLPKLNSPVLVDPDTGKLAPTVVKGYETLCKAALERMISNEEVSEIEVYVNPNQDILANSELQIEMSVVPMGTARRIIVNLGFKNPFQLKAVAKPSN